MPGTPPVTPNFEIPRFSDADEATFSEQVNAVADVLDAKAVQSGTDVSFKSVTLTGTGTLIDTGDVTLDSSGLMTWAGDTTLDRLSPTNAGRTALVTNQSFRAGNLGLVTAASNDTRLVSNYYISQDRLIDTGTSSWAVFLGDGSNDRLRIGRANATGGAPVYSVLASLSSSGLLTAAGGVTLDAGSGTAGQTLTLTGRNANAGASSTLGVDSHGNLTVDGPSQTYSVAGTALVGLSGTLVHVFHDLTVDGNLNAVTPPDHDDSTLAATTAWVNRAVGEALSGIGSSTGTMNYAVFTTSSTWTVPTGVSKVRMRLIGAGGGGSGGTNGVTGGSFQAPGSGGYGGAAGLVIDRVINVNAGHTLTINVGAGGVGGAASSAGGQGGTTNVLSSGGVTLTQAYGGQGGGNGSPAVYGSSTRGAANSTDTLVAGSGGQHGGPSAYPFLLVVGGGGGSDNGPAAGGSQQSGPALAQQQGGASGGAGAGLTAADATMPGCGGGGGGAGNNNTSAGAGGRGAPGLVEFWW